MTALLLIALTLYLAAGLAWTAAVALARLLLDEPISWAGALGQWLLWPWALWILCREGGE
jgi:hypothetical protein